MENERPVTEIDRIAERLLTTLKKEEAELVVQLEFVRGRVAELERAKTETNVSRSEWDFQRTVQQETGGATPVQQPVRQPESGVIHNGRHWTGV